MTYSTLLLDFDHTLFDSDTSEATAFAETLQQCGIADPGAHFDTYRKINHALWAAVEQGHIDPNEVRTRRFEQLARTIGLDANPEAITDMADSFIHAMGANGDLYPRAQEIMAASPKGLSPASALSTVDWISKNAAAISLNSETVVRSTFLMVLAWVGSLSSSSRSALATTQSK